MPSLCPTHNPGQRREIIDCLLFGFFPLLPAESQLLCHDGDDFHRSENNSQETRFTKNGTSSFPVCVQLLRDARGRCAHQGCSAVFRPWKEHSCCGMLWQRLTLQTTQTHWSWKQMKCQFGDTAVPNTLYGFFFFTFTLFRNKLYFHLERNMAILPFLSGVCSARS